MEIAVQYEPPATKIPFDTNNKFNVFLNFRGKDVRTTFVDHLYESLSGEGLKVFLDSEELEKGKEIDSNLQEAIKTSDVLIRIFSKHYAESTWCLKEAAQMWRSNGFIIPLFYDVEPSDVRYPQREGGPFAKAFQKHYSHLDRQDEKTIKEWKNVLHQISSLSGWTRAEEFGLEYKNSTLVDLQRAILRRLVNYHGEVSSVAEGKALMKNVLQGVRALVILDDVNDLSYLDALNGDWCGPGKDEALQLFCWHAFSRAFAETPYKKLSTRIARACKGHPLSLQVIGAYLFDKKERDDIQYWEEALHNIGENQEISKVLRISYDGLSHVEKEMFLDIACCFAGKKENDAVTFWEVLYPKRVKTALKNLSLKMLINESGPKNLLDMHDLLRGMGKGIQEQIDNNSRLLLPMGSHRALSRDRAEPVSFHRMPSIRYLVVQNTKIVGNIGKFAPNLLWIKIKNCELGGMYTWLTLRNRFQLDSSWSQVRILSVEQCPTLTIIPKILDSLVNFRCLYLQDCVALTILPDTLGNMAQLKELHLCGCTNLTSLPETVGNLMQLEILRLKDCTALRSLPSTIGNLVQLQELVLKRCTGLRNVPNTIGDLAQLQTLITYNCSSLQSIPYPFGKLKNLRRLHIPGWTDLESFHDAVISLAQLRELSRSVGIGSSVQKKINVYIVYHAADERKILMAHKYKHLRTGSLCLCTGSEDKESSDIRDAIDSCEILVLGLSKSFAESIVCMKKFAAIRRSKNGLIVSLSLRSFTQSCRIKFLSTLREL
ncbi:disease resistance protein RPV1-like [Cryptomeria japonica]|uniref:disease resistance protein RPV1-like n=1 Tax=Cryptomeria japonica TaxID=3369 RepID=UPI0027DA0D4A|nr:disease resistance protein RPV1-like [Cryptomeria japonica]